MNQHLRAPLSLLLPKHLALSRLLRLLRLLLLSCHSLTASAHVVLLDPAPRTDNDYLYSFEPGVCNPTDATTPTCNAFCGDPYEINFPITTITAGVPTTIQWKTNIVHEPRQYRLSFNAAAGDDGFDLMDNILTIVDLQDAAEDPDNPETGIFSANVTFPAQAVSACSDANSPCVLQLFDLYYFVSCANIILTTAATTTTMEPLENLPTSPPTTPATSRATLPTKTIGVLSAIMLWLWLGGAVGSDVS